MWWMRVCVCFILLLLTATERTLSWQMGECGSKMVRRMREQTANSRLLHTYIGRMLLTMTQRFTLGVLRMQEILRLRDTVISSFCSSIFFLHTCSDKWAKSNYYIFLHFLRVYITTIFFIYNHIYIFIYLYNPYTRCVVSWFFFFFPN